MEKLNIDQATYEKIDNSTIRIFLPPPFVDVNIDELLVKKSEYEAKIKEVDDRINLAVANWNAEQAEYQAEIDKIDSVIAQCDKVNIKVEEKPLISEDEVVPMEKEV